MKAGKHIENTPSPQLLPLNAGIGMVGVCQEVTFLHHVSPCIPERQQATA